MQERLPAAEIPSNKRFAEWSKDQQKAFFETPSTTQLIREKVAKEFQIPADKLAFTTDSPLIDNKGDHFVVYFRVSDTRSDKTVRHPDVITIEIKANTQGEFISMPKIYVAHRDRSAQTRSQELQALTNGAIRNLRLDI